MQHIAFADNRTALPVTQYGQLILGFMLSRNQSLSPRSLHQTLRSIHLVLSFFPSALEYAIPGIIPTICHTRAGRYFLAK